MHVANRLYFSQCALETYGVVTSVRDTVVDQDYNE